jgi:hypothetical protein
MSNKPQETTTVYLTRYNYDMTEGRGPMVNDVCFFNEQDAKDYIDSKSGVMGRKEKWSEKQYGDWDVVPVTVYPNLASEEEIRKDKVRRKALDKLNQEEKEVLGLVDIV